MNVSVCEKQVIKKLKIKKPLTNLYEMSWMQLVEMMHLGQHGYVNSLTNTVLNLY